ncbi:PREDICTED: basic proline-rich protein-like, partial [Lipotes vexillifer]|uniref:Basic proline-rich protein-like n=1 Tax=Lipotes vexillifer TaxID=118797 RepID=A0A340X8A9_LIPVE
MGARPRGRRPPGGATRRAGPGGETPGTTPRPPEGRGGDWLCVPTKRVRGPPAARPRAPPAAQRPCPGALRPAGLLSPTPLPHPGHPGTARGLSPPAPAPGGGYPSPPCGVTASPQRRRLGTIVLWLQGAQPQAGAGTQLGSQGRAQPALPPPAPAPPAASPR